MVIVIMGVTGAGKTTIGHQLARRLGWPFHDGDAFHPAANVAKMASGIPLTDEDRVLWLEALAKLIGSTVKAAGNAIVACSALKADYRRRLRVSEQVRFVHLELSAAEARRRLSLRAGHFMPVHLVESQFEALEPPPEEEALRADAEQSPEEIVQQIMAGFNLPEAGASDA